MESSSAALLEDNGNSDTPTNFNFESVQRNIDDGECTLEVHRLVARYLGDEQGAPVAIQFWCQRLAHGNPADSHEAVWIAEAVGMRAPTGFNGRPI
jgi:hypothetical protein